VSRANCLKIIDQVLSCIGSKVPRWNAPTGAALIEEDRPKPVWIEYFSLLRTKAAAWSAMEKDYRNARADGLNIDAMTVTNIEKRAIAIASIVTHY